MSHYYEEDPNLESKPCTVHFEMNSHPFVLNSDSGVFSASKLDTGTAILLETVLQQAKPVRTVLDLGCGIGPVGVVLGSLWNARVLGIDTNAKAARLARDNYRNAHVEGRVLVQDGLQDLDEKFDCILLNPPIRTGKQTIYRLFSEAADHLTDQGALWIVIRKQHGAASAVDYLEKSGLDVRRVSRDKGFWVLKVIRPKL